VGVGLYLKTLRAAVQDFKANDGAEVLLMAPRGDVDHTTSEGLADGLRDALPAAGVSRALVAEVGDRLFSVTALPVRDAQGEIVARLVAASDDTDSLSRARSIELGSLLATATLVILTVGGVYGYIRRALRPLRRVVSATQAVAGGDLTVSVACRSRDEIGELGAAVDAMIGQLRVVVDRIVGSTAQFATATEEMTAITNRMRDGMAEQSSSTDQVATAMTEMCATVDEVARNTASAADAARDADGQARTGREVVQRASAAIEELARAMERGAEAVERLRGDSEKIGRVLDVIRAIAEQTNLLALNAAIEAARAGEQGRGFAVVAEEVRSLANRTQTSTLDIQAMIESLQTQARAVVAAMGTARERTRAGVAQAGEADAALERITAAVTAINEMNTQIASAAQQQSAVSQDISQNVVRISQIAEETAVGAGHTATASQQLATLAVDLQQLVQGFRVQPEG
jgi:methyl-accepting chemotaxis protein